MVDAAEATQLQVAQHRLVKLVDGPTGGHAGPLGEAAVKAVARGGQPGGRVGVEEVALARSQVVAAGIVTGEPGQLTLDDDQLTARIAALRQDVGEHQPRPIVVGRGEDRRDQRVLSDPKPRRR